MPSTAVWAPFLKKNVPSRIQTQNLSSIRHAQNQQILVWTIQGLGSGGGSVGKAVAFNAIDPFES